MRKFGLTLLIICSLYSAFSQRTSKKIIKSLLFNEIYSIEKKSKEKSGEYLKIDNQTNDTLIKGYYLNNCKSGTWTYYNNHNRNDKLFLTYNYGNKEILLYSDSISLKDTFYIRNDSRQFILTNVDSPPIYLGYKDEWKNTIASKVRIPVHIFEQGLSGVSVFSIVINKEGRLGEINVLESFDNSFENEITKTIKEIEGDWLPAYYYGKPADSKFMLFVALQEDALVENKKAYVWLISMKYSSL